MSILGIMSTVIAGNNARTGRQPFPIRGGMVPNPDRPGAEQLELLFLGKRVDGWYLDRETGHVSRDVKTGRSVYSPAPPVLPSEPSPSKAVPVRRGPNRSTFREDRMALAQAMAAHGQARTLDKREHQAPCGIANPYRWASENSQTLDDATAEFEDLYLRGRGAGAFSFLFVLVAVLAVALAGLSFLFYT